MALTKEQAIALASARLRLKKSTLETEEAKEPENTDFSVLETIKNIPASGGKFLKDLAYPFMHPVQTADALQSVGQGIVEKAVPDTINGVDFGETENEQSVNAIGNALKDRYGGVDNIKRTVMNDPVGVLADASILATGGASAVPKAGKGAAIVSALKNTGKAIDPLNMVLNTSKAAAAKLIPKNLPNRMYENAVKFSTTLDKPTRERMVATALKENIMPTARGIDKLNDIIKTEANKINDILDAATKEGVKVSRKKILRNINKLRKELGSVSNIDGAEDLAKLNKEVAKIHKWLNKKGADSLTPNEVQKLKKNLYDKLKYDEKNQVANYAKEETRKATARGAKESLEDINPEIKQRNKRAGDLIELRDQGLERSASRIDNRDFIGLDPVTKIAPGAVLGGPAGTAVGTGLAVAGHPKIKPYLALKLNQMKGQGPLMQFTGENNSLLATLLRQADLLAGRTGQELQ